jgi:hypothetical protein
MTPGFQPGFLATAIGSLPHTDPVAACDLIRRYIPRVPVWPQLPRRDPRESMYVQFSRGFPGLVHADGRIYVDRARGLDAGLERLYERYLANDLEGSALDTDHAAGLVQFARSTFDDVRAVKGQVVGPVSWALTVTDQERRSVLYDDVLADAAAKHLRLAAAWQEQALSRLSPQTIIFVDEPYLASFGSAFMAVERHEVIALLEEVFGGLRGLKGIHCCGNTDWSLILQTSVDILSFDAYNYAETLSLYPEDLRAFLGRGGIVAWGVVPTADEAQVMAESPAGLVDRLWEALRRVASKGVPLDRLLAASLVTPACGTATLSEPGAVRVLELLSEVSNRMRDAMAR